MLLISETQSEEMIMNRFNFTYKFDDTITVSNVQKGLVQIEKNYLLKKCTHEKVFTVVVEIVYVENIECVQTDPTFHITTKKNFLT